MKKKTGLSTTETVNEIGKINFSGNIIPHSWYDFIVFPNGKPDLAAIIILSEIIWWYRPREVFDKKTRRLIGYERKFKEDKLQYGHKQFAQKFGLTSRQTFRACKNLKGLGLITIELRVVELNNGARLGNVMFVEPIPQKIIEITFPDNPNIKKSTNAADPITLECNRVLHSNVQPYDIQMSDPITLECNTYTKITTETTTERDTERGEPQNGYPKASAPKDEIQKQIPSRYVSEWDMWKLERGEEIYQKYFAARPLFNGKDLTAFCQLRDHGMTLAQITKRYEEFCRTENSWYAQRGYAFHIFVDDCNAFGNEKIKRIAEKTARSKNGKPRQSISPSFVPREHGPEATPEEAAAVLAEIKKQNFMINATA